MTKMKYRIVIGGVVLTNDTNRASELEGLNADLESLRFRKSDSSTENDLTLIISNKHHKYNGLFNFQDKIDVTLIAEEWRADKQNPNGTPASRRTYHICSGHIHDINYNYKYVEIMGSGAEVDFAADANEIDKPYQNRQSWGNWLEVITDLVVKQGSGGNMTFPGGIISLGMEQTQVKSREWTLVSTDSCATSLDKICNELGAHWYSEQVNGLATLYIVKNGYTPGSSGTNMDGYILLDSYASNGLDYLNKIVVIGGSRIPIGRPDDYLLDTQTIKGIKTGGVSTTRQDRSITIFDPNVTNVQEAQYRAEEVYEYGNSKFSVLKIQLANHAPSLGELVTWTDDLGDPQSGVVQGMEVVFDSATGFVTTVEVKSTGV